MRGGSAGPRPNGGVWNAKCTPLRSGLLVPDHLLLHLLIAQLLVGKLTPFTIALGGRLTLLMRPWLTYVQMRVLLFEIMGSPV